MSGKGSEQKVYMIATIVMNKSEATYICHNGDLLLSMDKSMWVVSSDGRERNERPGVNRKEKQVGFTGRVNSEKQC